MWKSGIRHNIILTLTSLCALQIAILVVVGIRHEIGFRTWRRYIPLILLTHAVAAWVLCLLRDKFYTLPDHKQLEQVNFTNILSLFRISATPTLGILVVLMRTYAIEAVVITLTVLIFLSDFLDGKIARIFHQRTQIGQYIDSWSDYLILLTIGMVFYFYSFISLPFFIAIIIRFLLPVFGISVRFIAVRNTDYHHSWFGKASVFAIMCVVAFSVMGFLFEDERMHALIRAILEAIATVGFIVPALLSWIKDLIASYHNSRSEL